MGKVAKTTAKAGKRHTFSSFKARIDSIKIEPTLNLNQRVYDDTDSSHFISTLQHWSEVNLSGNLTDFVYSINKVSNSLPQILHHQDLIFQKLVEHISKNDSYSIQPLLELLTQFIHDLGPDFMKNYKQTLELLTNLALEINPNDIQNNQNSSNLLEWVFNCLTFIFKYLSKYLVDDFESTFSILLRILTLNNRHYLSRFCSEAISFLIKKMKQSQLKNAIIYLLQTHSTTFEENLTFRNSLIIIFSESIKSTKDSFHSKGIMIFQELLKTDLVQSNYLISGILIEILHHGTTSSVQPYINALLEVLQTQSESDVSDPFLICSAQILTTLVFTESGKRIKSWDPIINFLKKSLHPNTNFEVFDNLSFCLTLCIRNCDLVALNRHFGKVSFKALLQAMPYHGALGFIDSSLAICKEKLSSVFNIEIMVNDYFNLETNQNVKSCERLSYFMLKHPEYHIELSPQLTELVFSEFSLTSNKSKQDIFWRLYLSKTIPNQKDLDFLGFFEELDLSYLCNIDLIGTCLKYIDVESIADYYSYLFKNFHQLRKSTLFLNEFFKFLSSGLNNDDHFELISEVSNNFSMDDNKLRLASIEFVINLYGLMKMECPEIYLQIRLIEQMPLYLNNARDIQLRIRNLTTEFVQTPKDSINCKIMSNYFFGLMTNKFQPCWVSVIDNLSQIIPSCEQYVWDLLVKFLTLDFKQQVSIYSDNGVVDDDNIENGSPVELVVNDQRINDLFISLESNFYSKYRHVQTSYLSHLETSSTNVIFSSNLREHVLQCILKVPEIAENHYSQFSSFLLNDLTTGWSLKDKDLLISCFSKIKNLKGLDNTRVLYNKLLLILTSKTLKTQRLALDGLINFKIGSINKYKDNLKNLLDDTLFKDEITKFITNDADSIIEDEDLESIMPIILRIFFGRVQGGTRSKSKNGKKIAIINSLPILNQDQLTAFLKLGSDKIGFQDLTRMNLDIDDYRSLKRINGYISLLSEIYSVLGLRFKDSLSSTIEPLIYSISVAQARLEDDLEDGDVEEELEEGDVEEELEEGEEKDLEDEQNVQGDQIDEEEVGEEKVDEEEVGDEEVQSNFTEFKEEKTSQNTVHLKIAKNIRQLGMKCLNQLFGLLGDYYDWPSKFDSMYKYIIKPRLINFSDENLQQPSSLLKLMVGWIKIPQIGKFLLIDDLSPVKAIISLLGNHKAKDSVVSLVLTFAIDCLETSINDDGYFTLLALIIESLFQQLPTIIDSSNDNEVINKSITILLLLIDGDYIDNDYTRNSLIESLTNVFNKSLHKINSSDRAKITISLCALVNDCNLSWDEFLPFYKSYAKGFKIFSDREVRSGLVELFNVIGSKFVDIEPVSDILAGLNSFSTDNRRLGDFNYENIIESYKKIDKLTDLTTIQWLPIIYCSLFYITEEEELVIRTNATYTLNHYIDCFSQLPDQETAKPYIQVLKDIILPEIRLGLKNPVETIQTEYINCLNHIVTNATYFTDFEDMKVLLFNNDEESNFFKNINHIQIHRRQRAIRRVAELRNSLRSSSISHYILPLIESYAYTTDEKLRNVGNEAISAIGLLVRCVSWNQFKSLIKKFIAKVKSSKPGTLKISISIAVAVSKSLYISIEAIRNNESEDTLKEFPKNPDQEIDGLILKDIVPTLQKVLNERNDDTIVDRVVISEALVNLLRCISEQKIEENLPGLLTSTCQVLRSRSEELRDAARKSLCKIVSDLGSKYFKFLLQELKGALTRGSQIHVLSYTMHSFLVAIQPSLKHGDLDESASLIVEIIMEDIFGAAGQEKDAEGYTNKMKEVKHKKSFDSSEMLTSNLSLTEFGEIIDPIKLILQQKISLKIQNKLDELLRRYALGLNHNEESTSRNILILSYQINQQSTQVFKEGEEGFKKAQAHKYKENSDDYFLIKLNARPLKTQVDFNQYMYTLQKFSFELLRSAISRHESLLTVGNMKQFIPLLTQGINSPHEGLMATSLRLLNTIIKLPFDQEINENFKNCARRALAILKDSPTTTNEVCQASLRFLATLIRHKSEINLKDTAISYVLVRIQPDLEEPQSQGLAFGFLKSVVSQHILLPEVYDVMEQVSQIMVVNHNREIRDMARSVYFQFFMEYDQGRGKLEKQFKFLLNNLNYETPSGRQSVLELINLIVNKAGQDLLSKISSSFFIGLSNILINDDSSQCKEMASIVIENIFTNLKDLDNVEKIFLSWINSPNKQLQRIGLTIYKHYITKFKFGHNKDIDALVLKKLEQVFLSSRDQDEDHDWHLVYTSLNVFICICNNERQNIVSEKFETLWKLIINILLYPHSWVRLNGSKLIGVLLSNLEHCKFELSNYDIQTIAYRLLHQLNAPTVSEDLGNQVIKNLVLITMKWNKENTSYIRPDTQESIDSKPGEVEDQDDNDPKYKLAIEYLVIRSSKLLKQNRGLTSKKCFIKLLAMVCQIINHDLLLDLAEPILLSLYEFSDEELAELSSECKSIIENKLGGVSYTESIAKVQRIVTSRRQERKSKRAQLAITAPEVAIKRQMKKHARSRDKRRSERDGNGYYHTKKKKRV